MERQITEERPTWSRIRCRRRAPETMAGLTRTARPASTTPDLDGRRTRRGPSLLESSSASSSNRGRADESAPNRARGADGPSPPCRRGLHQHRRGFCLHVDGEEVAGAAPNRCLVGVAARFYLRLEGDKTNAVEWGGRGKQRACCFVFLTPGAPTAAFTCGP